MDYAVFRVQRGVIELNVEREGCTPEFFVQRGGLRLRERGGDVRKDA